MRRAALLLVVLPLACSRREARHEASADPLPSLAAVAPASSPATPGAVPPTREAPLPPAYGWPDASRGVDTLHKRFAPPAGFARVAAEKSTFGAFLRELPLTAAGTAVKDHRGNVIRAGDDPNIAAVVAIDVGAADLQQCADSILRLHAEWRWTEGDREHSYKAASSLAMPLARYARGDRVVMHGRDIVWEPKASSRPLDHALFREYLDTVFAWANTGSLARDTQPITVDVLRPGDFFVLPGGPGHAVLVLDAATSADGKKMVLLGQGFMPAQSFQVLRPSGEQTWYAIDPAAGGVKTPFWPTFPWSSLRRFG